MAKIKKETFKYLGKWLEFEVHYNSNRFFHLKDYPSDWASLGGFLNSHQLESNLVSGAKVAAKKAEEALKTIELVLLVEFKVGGPLCMIYEKIPGGGTRSKRNGEFPAKFTDWKNTSIDWGFSFDWAVYFKESKGEKIVYYDAELLGGDHVIGHQRQIDPDRFIEMPFTQERLEFFEAMGQATKKMALKISEFLNRPAEDLLVMIDSGTKLLGP